VIHVYAVLPADAEIPPVEGLAGRPVEARRADGLTAAVSVLAEPPEGSADAIVRHGAVVDALADANSALLPARFGTGFASEEALAAELARRADELCASLEAVRGCVEIAVRVSGGDAPGPESLRAANGADYLRGRLTEVRREERLAALVHEPLAARARASTHRQAARGGLLLKSAYLVEEEALPRFRLELERLEREHPELVLVSTGPWPPYSFAEAPERE